MNSSCFDFNSWHQKAFLTVVGWGFGPIENSQLKNDVPVFWFWEFFNWILSETKPKPTNQTNFLTQPLGYMWICKWFGQNLSSLETISWTSSSPLVCAKKSEIQRGQGVGFALGHWVEGLGRRAWAVLTGMGLHKGDCSWGFFINSCHNFCCPSCLVPLSRPFCSNFWATSRFLQFKSWTFRANQCWF